MINFNSCIVIHGKIKTKCTFYQIWKMSNQTDNFQHTDYNKPLTVKLPSEITELYDKHGDVNEIIKRYNHFLLVYHESNSSDLIGIWLPTVEAKKIMKKNKLRHITKSSVVEKHVKIINPRATEKKMLLSINSTLSDSDISKIWSKYLPNHTRERSKNQVVRKIPSDHKLEEIFINSIWIVPNITLLAYVTVNNISVKASDQTVWTIDKYEGGYIFGTAYVTIDGKPNSKTTLVGSITPLGDVLLAFHDNDIITSGYGKFKKINGKWRFVMQANTLNSLSVVIVGVSHWSYMIQITKCDPEYFRLPGVNISVPQFISLFDTQ